MLVLLFLAVDYRVKASPAPGFHPAEAHWVVAAQNFPHFWQRLRWSDMNTRFRSGVALPQEDWVLQARLDAGVSMTPLRWRAWLGRRFVAAGTASGTGFSVKPGLLVRALSSLRALGTNEAISSYGEWRYAWREGFLIVSKSRAYVAQCLSSTAPLAAPAPEQDALRAAWTRTPAGDATIYARPGLPVQAHVQIGLEPASAPLTVVKGWESAPIISITATRPNDLLKVLNDLVAELPMSEAIGYTIEEAQTEFPNDFWDSGSQFTFAILGLDLSESLPVPALALILDRAEPLPPAPPDAIAYAWNTQSGWLRPWLGEQFTVSTTDLDDSRLIASRESLVPAMLASLQLGPVRTADLLVEVSWDGTGAVLGALFERAADLELLHRMNGDDFRERYLPYFEALRNMGNAKLEGFLAGPGAVRVQGLLIDPSSGGEPVQ